MDAWLRVIFSFTIHDLLREGCSWIDISNLRGNEWIAGTREGEMEFDAWSDFQVVGNIDWRCYRANTLHLTFSSTMHIAVNSDQ